MKPGDTFTIGADLWEKKTQPTYMFSHPRPANRAKAHIRVLKVFVSATDIYYLCTRFRPKFGTYIRPEFVIKASEILNKTAVHPQYGGFV